MKYSTLRGAKIMNDRRKWLLLHVHLLIAFWILFAFAWFTRLLPPELYPVETIFFDSTIADGLFFSLLPALFLNLIFAKISSSS